MTVLLIIICIVVIVNFLIRRYEMLKWNDRSSLEIALQNCVYENPRDLKERERMGIVLIELNNILKNEKNRNIRQWITEYNRKILNCIEYLKDGEFYLHHIEVYKYVYDCLINCKEEII